MTAIHAIKIAYTVSRDSGSLRRGLKIARMYLERHKNTRW